MWKDGDEVAWSRGTGGEGSARDDLLLAIGTGSCSLGSVETGPITPRAKFPRNSTELGFSQQNEPRGHLRGEGRGEVTVGEAKGLADRDSPT